MKYVRASNERGFANHGWLESRHTFSFASYYDPRHVGFRSLRVINEDVVRGGGGFGRHPHRDMEIISYVMRGQLVHEDSMGNRAVIRPGEVQRMSAGTGIEHAEFNGSTTEDAHFLQIWIHPYRRGLAPSYAQRSFADELTKGGLILVASPDGRAGSLSIHQDADLFVGRAGRGEDLTVDLRAGRGLWVQVIRGSLTAGDLTLNQGDGLVTDEAGTHQLRATTDAEIIVFDLA